MDILETILEVLAFPFQLYSYLKDHPLVRNRIIRIIYIINTISLLSCSVLYFCKKLYLESAFEKASLAWLYDVLIFPGAIVVTLRLLFLPYIHSIIWAVLYIKYLKDYGEPQKETTRFIILSILSIVGCIFMELAYYDFSHAIMSV